MERIKTLTDIVTAWIGIAALVGGGFFAVFQYLAKEQSDRVKESLHFLDRYNNKSFSDARSSIDTAWAKHQKSLNHEPFSEKEYDDLVLRIIETEKLDLRISKLFDFFESLQVCIDRNICDAQVAALLFRPEACAYFHHLTAKITLERADRKDQRYGLAIEQSCERR